MISSIKKLLTIKKPRIESFNVDKDDNSSCFTDILINSECFFPESIILKDWIPIGVAYGEDFLKNAPDTYLFLHKSKKQALCVYGLS